MPHLFLYGPSGTGKTTIGQLLARNLKLPFVDVDQIIESHAGKSVQQIIEEQGEPVFRDLEANALQETASHVGGVTSSKVIALGGGTLLRNENRTLVEAQGKVILLMADVDTLYQRLSEGSHGRPLLAGDLREKLTSLLAQRKTHYDSFPLGVNANQPLEKVVWQIQMLLGRYHLSAMGEYDVIVGQVSDLTDFPMQNSLIVTDENIAKLHLEKIKAALSSRDTHPTWAIIPSGEEHKNLDTVHRLWQAFLENGLDRKSTIVALGGGVIGDLAGFAASTYLRGIQWIAVPTTLLSMVDASLGGKTGFDLPEGKNLIGSFHPPRLVLADPQLLQTLPAEEFRSGMAEVVKHGIISDPELFALCSRGLDWVKANLEEMVKRAMAVKIKIIEEDPYEKGIRAWLNLGHTVGHAVELVSRFQLRHGEAVAIGMVAEAKYAARVGLASAGLVEAIKETLSTLGLPIGIPARFPREEILRAMRVDKKKDSKVIRFALPVEIGKVQLVEVSDLEAVIHE